jgi:hypothetical protein
MEYLYMRFHSKRVPNFAPSCMSIAAFWVVSPCSVVGCYRRFGGTDGGGTPVRNVSNHLEDYM